MPLLWENIIFLESFHTICPPLWKRKSLKNMFRTPFSLDWVSKVLLFKHKFRKDFFPTICLLFEKNMQEHRLIQNLDKEHFLRVSFSRSPSNPQLKLLPVFVGFRSGGQTAESILDCCFFTFTCIFWVRRSFLRSFQQQHLSNLVLLVILALKWKQKTTIWHKNSKIFCFNPNEN